MKILETLDGVKRLSEQQKNELATFLDGDPYQSGARWGCPPTLLRQPLNITLGTGRHESWSLETHVGVRLASYLLPPRPFSAAHRGAIKSPVRGNPVPRGAAMQIDL